MAVLIIISGILLVLLAGFLLVPVSLYIDTDEKRYEVFQRPVFRFFLSTVDSAISPRLQLAGIRIPLQSNAKARKPGNIDDRTNKKPKRKSRFKRSASRSEEHTSELQSREKLVCRLLLEQKQ